jgi:hypothetical protein
MRRSSIEVIREILKQAYGEEALNMNVENPHTVSSPVDKAVSRER